MLLTVFYYCTLIIFLPVTSFFLARILLTNFDLSSTSQNIYSAVIAVVVLHISLALYLIKGKQFTLTYQLNLLIFISMLAYSEDKPKPVVKQD